MDYRLHQLTSYQRSFLYIQCKKLVYLGNFCKVLFECEIFSGFLTLICIIVIQRLPLCLIEIWCEYFFTVLFWPDWIVNFHSPSKSFCISLIFNWHSLLFVLLREICKPCELTIEKAKKIYWKLIMFTGTYLSIKHNDVYLRRDNLP